MPHTVDILNHRIQHGAGWRQVLLGRVSCGCTEGSYHGNIEQPSMKLSVIIRPVFSPNRS